MMSPDIQVINTTTNGSGVFAYRAFQPDEFIEFFAGFEIDHPPRYSVYLDGCHIEPTNGLKYLNHSCAPNGHFKSRDLVALTVIEPGEEITINYKTTEERLVCPFECQCGSPNCLGLIE
jgi:SET domain-containing protein